MSIAQFNKEVCTFRTLFGTKSFWANRKTVLLAKKALGVSYVAVTGSPEEIETAAITMQSTMGEFLTRANMMGFDI